MLLLLLLLLLLQPLVKSVPQTRKICVPLQTCCRLPPAHLDGDSLPQTIITTFSSSSSSLSSSS
jgi:hypothetical protein